MNSEISKFRTATGSDLKGSYLAIQKYGTADAALAALGHKEYFGCGSCEALEAKLAAAQASHLTCMRKRHEVEANYESMLVSYEQLQASNARLREENEQLKQLLQTAKIELIGMDFEGHSRKVCYPFGLRFIGMIDAALSPAAKEGV